MQRFFQPFYTPSKYEGAMGFCRQSGFLVSSINVDSYKCIGPLLTAFCQGSVCFPYERRHDVLQSIAEDVKNNIHSFWNQIAYEHDGCRLVVDIDSKTRVFTNREIQIMSVCLHSTVQQYATLMKKTPNFEVYISVCGPRRKKEKLSTGVHMICTVVVNIDQAKHIIEQLQQNLTKSNFNMEDVEVDSQIYHSQAASVSLRLVYSHKVEVCSLCCNDTMKTMSCQLCQQQGQVISTFTYEPYMYVNTHGTTCKQGFTEKHKDFESILQHHSIWPEANDMDLRGLDIRHHQKPKKRKRQLLPVSNQSTHPIETFLRNAKMHNQHVWKNIQVSKVTYGRGKRSVVVNVTGDNSGYCVYSNKDHGQSRIWFLISIYGKMVCYCFCKKSEYGCTNIAKKKPIGMMIPYHLKVMLFPKVKRVCMEQKTF